jgi:serine/threonine protein kinase
MDEGRWRKLVKSEMQASKLYMGEAHLIEKTKRLGSKHVIITPFYEGQTLADWLDNNRSAADATLLERLHLAKLILEQAKILKSLGLAHNDLSSENMIVKGDKYNQRVRLIDFGQACAFYANASKDILRASGGASPNYRASEMFYNKDDKQEDDSDADYEFRLLSDNGTLLISHDPMASDIFSIGVIFGEIFTGKKADHFSISKDDFGSKMKPSSSFTKTPDKYEILGSEGVCDADDVSDIRKLLLGMQKIDPTQRTTLEKAINKINELYEKYERREQKRNELIQKISAIAPNLANNNSSGLKQIIQLAINFNSENQDAGAVIKAMQVIARSRLGSLTSVYAHSHFFGRGRSTWVNGLYKLFDTDLNQIESLEKIQAHLGKQHDKAPQPVPHFQRLFSC